ncbi:MAG TPA: thiamine pyrophosphate-binding protein [Marmoricola sp.]|nr:thiamine pyrophosphate-binding protein [Marmoricola sp.]
MTEPISTADVVALGLAASGVKQVFAYPGDPIIELMERFRVRDVDVVLARREGTAAFMAEGVAQATGDVGVCLSTLGPGSSALVNGVAAANVDRVPMLALSGQIETSREQFFTHQVIDHKLLFSPITKWTGRLEPGSAATTLRKALATATAERPGAVHLTLPGDVTTMPATDADFVPPPADAVVRTVSVRGSGDPVRMIEAARRPVILAGIGATRARATDALVAFAEKAGIPVVVAPMAKGVFPEDHELFAGVLDMACNQVLWKLLGDADLIITAGFDAVELIKPWSLRTPVLHVDSLSNSDQIYQAATECVGDIAAIYEWFAAEWKGEPRWSSADVQQHRTTLREAYYAGRVSDQMNPTDVVDAVRASFGEDTVAACDVGSHKLLVGQGWTTNTPRGLLMTNGLSSMGFGVPAAIAAQHVLRDRQVVAMVGDGGFAMAATEMRLASALGLGLVVVVFVDGSLNRIELKQMEKSYPSTATRIEDTDLVQLASSMACDGARAESVRELEKVLAEAHDLSRPLIVEARISPQQYESQF